MEKLVVSMKDDQLLIKDLLNEIFKRVDPIYKELMGKDNTMVNCAQENREMIRLKDAAGLLGGYQARSFEWLKRHGIEGIKKGPREVYIYVDSIKNFKPMSYKRGERGKITLLSSAYRAGITYKEAKEKCESMGIPVIRKGRTLYLTEADSARLVLQYKI